MSQDNVDTTLTDDDVLSFTQKTRKGLADKLLQDGMPDSTEDRKLLLQTLGDMDHTALSKKKLGAQERIAEADRIAIMAMRKIDGLLGGRNPFEGDADAIPATARRVEVDVEKLPPPNPVEGETDIGISGKTYTEFMSEFEGRDKD